MRLDIREVDGEIAELERSELTRTGAYDLAVLYTIRKELTGRTPAATETPAAPVSYTAPPSPARTLGEYGDSDFLHTVAGKDIAAFMSVMNNLMDSLRRSNIKQYNIVMERLSRI